MVFRLGKLGLPRLDAGLGLSSVWLSLVLVSPAIAHGGGLDANGCHHNRKTGDYHCHGSRAPAAPNPPTVQRLLGGVVYFATCAAARAAGAAPFRRGDPGYREGLDRDGDGKACE